MWNSIRAADHRILDTFSPTILVWLEFDIDRLRDVFIQCIHRGRLLLNRLFVLGVKGFELDRDFFFFVDAVLLSVEESAQLICLVYRPVHLLRVIRYMNIRPDAKLRVHPAVRVLHEWLMVGSVLRTQDHTRLLRRPLLVLSL